MSEDQVFFLRQSEQQCLYRWRRSALDFYHTLWKEPFQIAYWYQLMDTTAVLFEMIQVSFVLLSIIRLTEIMPKLTSGAPLFEMSGMLEDQTSEQFS